MATYSYLELQALWQLEGGSPSSAALAASVALAESGGRTDAVGAADDVGLWQIVPAYHPQWTHDQLLSPKINAEAAVAISSNGTSWSQWCTAYTDGACGKKGGHYDPTGASPAGTIYRAHGGAQSVRVTPVHGDRTVTVGDVRGPALPGSEPTHLPEAFHHLARAFATTLPTRSKLANHLSRNFTRAVKV